MAIWKHPTTLEDVNQSGKPDNMISALGIRFTAIGDDFLEATMPVSSQVKQPFGIMHGGASCVLAETVGSVASLFVVGLGELDCFGVEINANHLRPVRSGSVTGRATPVHLGSALHVWDIRITDDQNRLVCISRLTVIVREKALSEATASAPRA